MPEVKALPCSTPAVSGAFVLAIVALILASLARKTAIVHIETNQISAELAKAVHGEMRRGNVIGYRSSMRISAKTAGSVLGATAP
jgi:hypothetical protein